MTTTADIVVIGGGVHGASLAFHLASAKPGKVILLEKDYVASGQTGKSGAMIRPMFTEAAYIQLVLQAIGMFERWDDSVGGDAGYVQRGFLRITESVDPDILAADLELMKGLGVAYEVLSAEELRRRVPTAVFEDREMGVFVPKGGYADPILTTATLASAARRLGAEVHEGVQVTGLRLENGRIEAVETNHGCISTRVVVNCGGGWGNRIAAMVGIQLPIEVHRTPTCLFRCPEDMNSDGPIFSDGTNRVYMRTMDETLLRVAHFGWVPDPADPESYDETVGRNQVNALRSAVERRYAGMRRTVFLGAFSAVYDMTPDGHPLIGSFPQVEGFWCNCGWSGNGFASAPAIGNCLAQQVLREKSAVDISVFEWPRRSHVKERPDLKWVYR